MYLVYRPDPWKMPLHQRIEHALAAYRNQEGGLPASIAVTPREVEAARQVMADMGLEMEVTALGGCLVREVWLIMDGTPVR